MRVDREAPDRIGVEFINDDFAEDVFTDTIDNREHAPLRPTRTTLDWNCSEESSEPCDGARDFSNLNGRANDSLFVLLGQHSKAYSDQPTRVSFDHREERG